MSRDNQNHLDLFYREFGAQVDAILWGGNNLLSAISELMSLYRPKSKEELNEFCGLKFKLPDSVGLLYDLQKTIKQYSDAFNDSNTPLSDMALAVVMRMVGADVVINDIITMYVKPHDGEGCILLYLNMMESMSHSISYMCNQLEKLYEETSQLWPKPSGLNYDADEEEESVLPGEVESFQLMRSILVKALDEYTDEYESERISGFFVAIQDYLEAFANGFEPDKEFDFGFVWETGNDDHHEKEYIDFHFELEMLQVSSGGHIYDKSVGGDSYTNWNYNIWLNGCDEGNNSYRFTTVLELIRAGGKLWVESPDEYSDYEQNE